MNDELFQAFKQRILSRECFNVASGQALVMADLFEQSGEPQLAATALDRAWGLCPENESLTQRRRVLLDSLAVLEQGMVFRYIPAGHFLMGSESGELDEQPVHAASTSGYWISDIPVTWAAYCDLMGWKPPPHGYPELEEKDRMKGFQLHNENKIRVQYCETETVQARNWHAHIPDMQWKSGDGKVTTSEEMFGVVPREKPQRPLEYNQKPMVAVAYQDAEILCDRISSDSVRYCLPTEAQWEKAARGGLIGRPYCWGDARPSEHTCDFGHFGDFRIRPPRSLPPNGYGLFGMCGGVWEWTAAPYDSLAYEPTAESRRKDATLHARAVRGGSWADCAEAVTVSFRMSLDSLSWTQRNSEDRSQWERIKHFSPNIGFRICRIVCDDERRA
jgi:formylglycine-generating enzyme required for sulfatase activity